MAPKTPLQRVAYSPGEFAALFGKSQTWGYRQIYAGTVKTITKHGRILIPAAEVERILADAGIYNGEKKCTTKPVSKADLWKQYMASRKNDKAAEGKSKRSMTLARMRPAKAGKASPARFRRR